MKLLIFIQPSSIVILSIDPRLNIQVDPCSTDYCETFDSILGVVASLFVKLFNFTFLTKESHFINEKENFINYSLNQFYAV